MSVVMNGRSKKVSLTAAIAMQLRAKALKGDTKVTLDILKLLDIDKLPEPAPQPTTFEQRRKVARFIDFEEIIAALVQYGLAEWDEDDRVRLRDDFFDRLFGPTWLEMENPEVKQLRDWYRLGSQGFSIRDDEEDDD